MNEVSKRISREHTLNWTPSLVRTDPSNSSIPSPKDYFNSLKNIPDNSVDVVLVDGRHRVESIVHSIPKVKIGGCIILDNSDRPEYKDAYKILSKWQLVQTSSITNFSDFVTPAAIWTKQTIE